LKARQAATTMEIERHPSRRVAAVGEEDDGDVALVEQVRLTVPTTDDPTLPVWTFRMWTIGIVSCALLSFFNQFFAYRTEPLIISQITVQVHCVVRPARNRLGQDRRLLITNICSDGDGVRVRACRWRRCRWGTSWRECCRRRSARRSAESGR
jgi:hypothetical protein